MRMIPNNVCHFSSLCGHFPTIISGTQSNQSSICSMMLSRGVNFLAMNHRLGARAFNSVKIRHRPNIGSFSGSSFSFFCNDGNRTAESAPLSYRALDNIHASHLQRTTRQSLRCLALADSAQQPFTFSKRMFSTSSSFDLESKEEPKESAVAKVKVFWKRYGVVGLSTYFGLYVVTFGGVYCAVSGGLLNLESIHASEDNSWLANIFNPEAATERLKGILYFVHADKVFDVNSLSPEHSTVALAWLITKFTEPARLATTLAITPTIARSFGRAPPKPKHKRFRYRFSKFRSRSSVAYQGGVLKWKSSAAGAAYRRGVDRLHGSRAATAYRRGVDRLHGSRAATAYRRGVDRLHGSRAATAGRALHLNVSARLRRRKKNMMDKRSKE